MATLTPPPPSAAADILAGLSAYPGLRGAVIATGDGVVVRSTLPDRTTSLDYAAAATRLVTKARTALRIIGRAPAVVAAAAVAAAAAKEGNAGKAALPLASGGGVAPNVVADAAATTAPATAAAPSDPAPPLLLRVRTRKGAEVTVAPVWGEGGKLGQCLVVVQGGEARVPHETWGNPACRASLLIGEEVSLWATSQSPTARLPQRAVPKNQWTGRSYAGADNK